MQFIKQSRTWRVVGNVWIRVGKAWKQVFSTNDNFNNTTTNTLLSPSDMWVAHVLAS
jgi:hypothetical protein